MIDEVLGRRHSATSKHNNNSSQHTERNSDGGDDDNDNDLALISASPHKKHTNSKNNDNNKYIKSPTRPAHTHTIHTTPAIRVKHKPKGTNPLASKVSSKVSR